jgi:hypothetical protein
MTMFHYFPAVSNSCCSTESMQNYYFGVVKFGIDERDSMLARQLFKQSWANPKTQEKTKDTPSDEMVVDRPHASDTKVDLEPEMYRVDAAKSITDNVSSGVPLSRKGETRSSKSYTMPIFAFQRQGIGAVNLKSTSHNRNTKSKA